MRKKNEEESRLLEAAIKEANAERGRLQSEAPSQDESLAGTEGETAPVFDESLSYDRGLYGFNRDSFSTGSSRGTPVRPVNSTTKVKTINTPNRRLFSNGDGER